MPRAGQSTSRKSVNGREDGQPFHVATIILCPDSESPGTDTANGGLPREELDNRILSTAPIYTNLYSQAGAENSGIQYFRSDTQIEGYPECKAIDRIAWRPPIIWHSDGSPPPPPSQPRTP